MSALSTEEITTQLRNIGLRIEPKTVGEIVRRRKGGDSKYQIYSDPNLITNKGTVDKIDRLLQRSELDFLLDSELTYDWPELSTEDLQKLELRSESFTYVQGLLHLARQTYNTRLHRFLKKMLDTRTIWPEMPTGWAAVVGGYPIVGEDIGVSAFQELVNLVVEVHPYKGKKNRREYHRLVAPIIKKITSQTQDVFVREMMDIWLQHSRDEITSERSKQSLVQSYLEKSLGENVTSYLSAILSDVTSWVSLVSFFIKILPDPDRLSRPPNENSWVSALILWVSRSINSFDPPLPKISHGEMSR